VSPQSKPRPKRAPEVVEIDEGGVLVKHCDNIEEAERLARTFMAKEYDQRPNEVRLPAARVIWCRIIHCLPNSEGAQAEGWSWMYQSCKGPGRGIFRAVAFDCAFPHSSNPRWSA
jgi:hypothetical protein